MIDQDMITRRLATYMKETNRRLDHLELLETPRVSHEDAVLLNKIMLFPATGGDVQFFDCTQAGVVAVLAAVVPGSGDLIVGNFAVSIPMLVGITIPTTTRLRHMNMRFTCGGSAVTLSNYDELEHCSIVQDGTGFATAYALDAYVAGAGVRDVKITNTYVIAMNATTNIGGFLKGVAQEHGPEAKSSWFQAFNGSESYSLYMLQDSFAESCYAGGNMASAHNIGVVFDSALSDQFRAGRFINGWVTVGLGGGGSVAWGVNISNNHYGTLIGTYVWGETIGVNLPAGNTLYVRNDTWNSISSLGTLTRLPGDGLSSYIWFDVKDYGAVGNGIVDDTAAVAACLAALVAAGGGVLYFPHGRYLTSGNFSLTAPTAVVGDGSPSYFDDSIANTVIICNSSTNSLFTVASVGCDFRDFFALNTHAAPIAGAGITVASDGDQIHFNNLTIRAFYTCLEIQDGAQWKVNGCYLLEPVKYGLHAQHTDFSGDFGDWSIDNTEISCGARDADAAIYVQSGGGGKITNTKINGWYISPPAGHAFLYGLYIGANVIQTGDILVSNCSLENILHDGIHIETAGGGSWDYIVITGSQFGMYGSDASAINIVAANVGDIHGVVLDGLVMVNNGSSAQAAIRLTKVDTVTVGTINNYGFTSDVNPTGCTNYYRTLSPVPATAANQVLISGASPFLPVWSTWFLTGTAGQTYTFPAAGGTVALTSDVPLISYGSMYADDAAIAVVIGASGSYYEVGSGMSDGGSSAAFTFQSSKELKCNTPGKYKATWSMSISSSNNNEIVAGAVMVNATHASNTEGSAENINGGKPVCVSGSGIITLVLNDVVKLCVENDTAAHDITVTHATLTLERVA